MRLFKDKWYINVWDVCTSSICNYFQDPSISRLRDRRRFVQDQIVRIGSIGFRSCTCSSVAMTWANFQSTLFKRSETWQIVFRSRVKRKITVLSQLKYSIPIYASCSFESLDVLRDIRILCLDLWEASHLQSSWQQKRETLNASTPCIGEIPLYYSLYSNFN